MPASREIPGRLRPRRPVWDGWKGSVSDLPAIALDLETTGLDPQHDRIIEVALVGPEGAVVESLVDPGMSRIPPGRHGIRSRDLASAPSFAELIPAIFAAVASKMLVAHWADFDLSFIEAECERAGHPLPPLPYLCTAALAEGLDLGHESRSLAHACERQDVALERPHTAACDAAAAIELFAAYGREADIQGHDLKSLPDPTTMASGAPDSWRLPPLTDVFALATAPAGECFPRTSF